MLFTVVKMNNCISYHASQEQPFLGGLI